MTKHDKYFEVQRHLMNHPGRTLSLKGLNIHNRRFTFVTASQLTFDVGMNSLACVSKDGIRWRFPYADSIDAKAMNHIYDQIKK